jgi:hypothetical protein
MNAVDAIAACFGSFVVYAPAAWLPGADGRSMPGAPNC